MENDKEAKKLILSAKTNRIKIFLLLKTISSLFFSGDGSKLLDSVERAKCMINLRGPTCRGD